MIRRGYTPFDNNFDALKPELWAYESLAILEEEMVIGNLTNRDYNSTLAKYGDTVNTDKPGEFRAIRKTVSDDVTVQDATTTNIQVVLNQWIHVSFVIKDGEQAFVWPDLVRKYLHPAMLANARFLDQSLLAHAAVGFAGTVRGGLGQLGSSTAKDYLIDLDDAMNQNKADGSGRNLILSSSSKAAALKAELFHAADKMGDGGRAMREAELGRKFGFNTYMALNVPHVTAATAASTTTTSAAFSAGASSVAVAAAIGKGKFFTVDGDYTPYRSTTNSTTLTPDSAFRVGGASGATVRPIASGAVNNASGYDAGYVGGIAVDGTGVPKVGQLVAFNSGDTSTGTLRTGKYVILQVNNSGAEIVLDRPLETALADDDAVCYGPNGDLNVAFKREAMTLVNRPMSLPMPGAGARSAFAEYNGLSMRVVIAYEPRSQGHIVTLDSLFGVKVVEPLLGAVLLG
jgi:hypothetical protein